MSGPSPANKRVYPSCTPRLVSISRSGSIRKQDTGDGWCGACCLGFPSSFSRLSGRRPVIADSDLPILLRCAVCTVRQQRAASGVRRFRWSALEATRWQNFGDRGYSIKGTPTAVQRYYLSRPEFELCGKVGKRPCSGLLFWPFANPFKWPVPLSRLHPLQTPWTFARSRSQFIHINFID